MATNYNDYRIYAFGDSPVIMVPCQEHPSRCSGTFTVVILKTILLSLIIYRTYEKIDALFFTIKVHFRNKFHLLQGEGTGSFPREVLMALDTNTSRRHFIRAAGGAALIVCASPFLDSCHAIVRSDLPRHDPSKGLPTDLDPQLADILYHASLAPSGHNAQPWTVTVRGPRHFIIGSDTRRWLPGVDPTNRELILSLGTFLENLIVAAGAAGFETEYDILAEERTALDLLDVKMRNATQSGYPLEKLALRRTVRKGLLSGELEPADIQVLSESVGGRLAYFPPGSPQGKYLKDATIEANRTQINRAAAQEELANWIRWSDADARMYRNGLTPEGMGITGIAGWYVKHFMSRKSVLTERFRKQTVDLVRKQVAACGGWLVITSEDSSIPTLIETGQRFEQMFLGIRERMIAIHPMTQVLEEGPFKDQVAQELGLTGDVQFILRTGYLTTYPRPVSLRMPVEWFVRG